MKKLFMLLGMFLAWSSVHAELSVKELFKQTEGKVLDFVILSSIEAGYARDIINGINLVVAQTPIVYLTPYISGDFGYITGYDDKVRGSLMFGGSLRINRLIEDIFYNKLALVRSYVPEADKHWDRLWIGPFVAKRFSDFEESGSLQAGIKAGLKW